MAISSAPLNSDSIDAQSALQRRGAVPGVRGATAGTDASFISNISPAGQAMLALDNFKASAETFKNSGSYRTVRYLQVVVQGVVGSLNALRNVLGTATATRSKYSAAMGSVLQSIDKTTAASELSALSKVGVVRNANGSFSIDQTQVIKAFNEDGANAFATVVDFAYQVSKAPPDIFPTDERRPERVTASDMNEAPRTPAQLAAAKEESPDTSMLQRLAAQLSEVGSYTARKAVNIYRTVYSL